jgi:hypothetical protein
MLGGDGMDKGEELRAEDIADGPLADRRALFPHCPLVVQVRRSVSGFVQTFSSLGHITRTNLLPTGAAFPLLSSTAYSTTYPTGLSVAVGMLVSTAPTPKV